MLTEDKITEIFVMADEFCKVFNTILRRRGLSETRKDRKRKYHRDCRMSQAEVIVIMIMFHSSNHKCLKHFYLNETCRRYRRLFPKPVSYNRFTELEKSVVVQFVIFVKNTSDKTSHHRVHQRRTQKHRTDRTLAASFLPEFCCEPHGRNSRILPLSQETFDQS